MYWELLMFWLRSWLCGLITLHFSLPSIASLKLNHADNWSLIQENAGIKSWRFGIFMHGTVSGRRSDSIQLGSQSIKSMWIFASFTKSMYLLGCDQFQFHVLPDFEKFYSLSPLSPSPRSSVREENFFENLFDYLCYQ